MVLSIGRFYYICHLIVTFVIFLLVACPVLMTCQNIRQYCGLFCCCCCGFFFSGGGGGGGEGGGVVMFFLKKIFFGWTICNVIVMFLLLYVHVCVTRTGWKTRPRPKTVILPIKKSVNQSICLCASVYLSVPPLQPPPPPPISLCFWAPPLFVRLSVRLRLSSA